MYKFEELEKLYKSIISIENGLAEFKLQFGNGGVSPNYVNLYSKLFAIA